MAPTGSAAEPLELNLLPEWREPVSTSRYLAVILGSLAIHIVAIVGANALPAGARPAPTPLVAANIRKSVRLVAPRIVEPTQKAPNTGKIKPELDIRSAQQTPQPQTPRLRQPS